ncbi:MAG: transglutaminase-like domain-containing protein [Thermodesulfovibrionales bacterium]|nr:transglutaminase-like domain-containing protein [Thermodesulfovibrionales bacterium]
MKHTMKNCNKSKIINPVLFTFIFIIVIVSALPCSAKTLILDGTLESRIKTTQRINFDVQQDVRSLTFRFAVPTTFSNKITSQDLSGLDIRFSPEPASVVDDMDKFGNRFKKVKWENLKQNISVTISYNTVIRAELLAMESASSFPLGDIQKDDAVFLKPTSMVQSDSEEIASLSKKLTENAKTENDAVNAVLNWVSDNIKYTYNPPQYDALYTLKTGKGNCQNFAHLSMALLRAAGIPARIVGGISLKRQWKVPVENGYLVQDMGQGGHAWMEILFPDLGWLSYDPQQSRQFTSTRHIKQTHGLDSKDINDSWSASPYLPRYSEDIEAVFNNDDVNIKLRASKDAPVSYIMSNNLTAKAAPGKKPAPAIKPATPAPKPVPVITPPLKPAPLPKKGTVEFGNMEFPTLVDVYQIIGNEATRVFDKETAEHVTSRYVYAQAFTLENTMALQGISLAMHKFGGDGTLYIDVVKDENGKPGLSGERSLLVSLSSIKFRPGYYWIDFAFAKEKEPSPVLTPGKYWIIMRHSGEAIVNWFFIPGNPYGDSDDTRSTLKGYKWEDLLNYDFVFKVKGRVQ